MPGGCIGEENRRREAMGTEYLFEKLLEEVAPSRSASQPIFSLTRSLN